ncbi:hypothetical protein ACFQHO_23745 [Actinomadura yumaensis]|uniref:hypothetical protein n=1 Tax=Actinomadura yumaensis TaxID=111807 RepID=UPI003609226A
MTTYRIDDLARAAETSVRNVRAFQERGVLPRLGCKGGRACTTTRTWPASG